MLDELLEVRRQIQPGDAEAQWAVESREYDAHLNVIRTTAAEGQVREHDYDERDLVTVVRQGVGALAATIDESFVYGTGLAGPVSESYTYDGLGRLTRAQSGDPSTGIVSTERRYDSLSRLRSETSLGRTVSYSHDDAGNLSAVSYPSGVEIGQHFDALDRPQAIGPIVSGTIDRQVDYGNRGPWLPAEKRFGRAGRLLHAANQVASAGYSYTFDTADNLLTRQDAYEDVSLPPDERNRPGSLVSSETATTTLAYDANGNLTDKAPFKYSYDFRNRLTRVTSSGVEVARYEYDAFNRRVRVSIPAQGETPAQEIESVWSGWQEIEQYRQGQLHQRMTYGRGLDEVVRLEADSDLNGLIETDLVPHYDETGNLVLLTDSADDVVGQYAYSPMGEHMAARADAIAPEVCQVTVADGDVSIEFCEEVRKDTIEIELRDLDQPSGVRTGPALKASVVPATHAFPVQQGRRSHRRLVITPTDPVPAGTQMELYVPAEGVKDLFLNPSAAAYSRTFTWPATSGLTVLEDTAAPEVEELRLSGGLLEISFSEPPDPASASASIQVDGQTVTWVAGADGYTLRSATALATGTHTVTIVQGAPVDRDGKGLPAAFEETISVDADEPDSEYYELPDPRVVPWTTFVNRFAFHGRPLDVETGLLYFRNRYYDPELGRFITADPLGYVDGPSTYQFAGYSPYDSGDPLGLLEGGDLWAFEPGLRERIEARRAEIREKRKELRWLRFEIAVREHLLPIDPLNRREELRQFFDAMGMNTAPAAGLVGYFLGPPGTVGSSPYDQFHSALGGDLAGTAEILDITLQIELAAVGLVEIVGGAGGLADEAINVNRYRAGLRADIQTAIRQRVLRNIAASQRGRPTEAFRRYAAIDRGFRVQNGPMTDPAQLLPPARGSGHNVLESSGRTFVSTSNGTIISIPEGWVARPAQSGRGIVYQRPGASGNADMIRVMDFTERYPKGYARYYNSQGQPLDVFGKPAGRAETHIPLDYQGSIPGWPQ